MEGLSVFSPAFPNRRSGRKHGSWLVQQGSLACPFSHEDFVQRAAINMGNMVNMIKLSEDNDPRRVETIRK